MSDFVTLLCGTVVVCILTEALGLAFQRFEKWINTRGVYRRE